MRRLKKVIKFALIVFAGFLMFLTGQTVAETIKINYEIKKFKKKSEYEKEINIDGATIKFYKVSRETYYPNELARDPFFDNDPLKPGAEGDIFVTRQAPIPEYPGFYEFVSFYFGGHAVYFGKNNDMYETFGFLTEGETLIGAIINGGETTYVQIEEDNYWLDSKYRREHEAAYYKFGSYYRSEWIGVRIKGIIIEEIEQMTAFMDILVEKEAQYNHLYIFNTKDRYYCTDMMSRGLGTITNSNGESKYNLNRDGIVTTVNDLILSGQAYISFYAYLDKNNVMHVYYID